jgi:hypothetical protein
MSKIPGDEIILEILNGNEKVLSAVYKKVLHHILNYGMAINAPTYIVKESVQDAFEIFYRQILDKKLELNCAVETYIISIAKHVLLKNEPEGELHLKAPLTQVDLIDEVNFEQTIDEQRHKLFYAVFKNLSEECKRILTLTLEGHDASQIKLLMNYSSDDFVRIKRKRCKTYLTEKIKESPDYEQLRNANSEDYELPLWRDEQP